MKRTCAEESNPVRIAIVGCGAVATCHLRGIANADGAAVLTVVVDPDAARRTSVIAEAIALGAAPKATQVTQHDHLEDIPGDAADVVLLCVPHDLHECLCMKALARGSCIVEKPLAPTLSACRRLIRHAQDRNVCLFVAEQSAFWPEVVCAQQLIRSGAIGEVVSVHAHYYESLVDSPFGGTDRSEKDPYNLGWRSSLLRAGGGVVIDGGLHWLRPIRMLAGEVSEVVASSARPFPQIEGESLAHALLKCEDGKEATFRATCLPKSHLSLQDPSFRIIGTTGEIVITGSTGLESSITLYNAEHRTGTQPPLPRQSPGSPEKKQKPVPRGFHGAFLPQWSSFLECLQTGNGGEISSAVEAAKDVALVEALYRSVRSGHWETVEEAVPEQEEKVETGSNAIPAVVDVPDAQLEFIKDAHAVDKVRHGPRGTSDLLTHLTEVRYLLKQQLGCKDPDLHAAALFHSIYGTEGFQGQTLPLSERASLQNLIGKRAEFIAYLNCVMERSTLDAAVSEFRATKGKGTYVICSRPEFGSAQINLSTQQLSELMLVHFADWAQQVADYNLWSYRKAAYASIAAALGGKCAQLYASTLANEPENAPKEVPEMIRARQLGVFDKIISGEISYEHLLDKTPTA